MKKKLYVGNLSFETTESDLKELFGQAGTVETVRIITDRDTAPKVLVSSKCRTAVIRLLPK